MDIDSLLQQIRIYDYHYYTLGEPLVTDAVYDALKKKLRDTAPDLCEYVGTPILNSQFSPVSLVPPMLSLANCMDYTELVEFMTKFPPDTSYLAETKMDGLALELSYIDGVLSHAATRGDGSTGEDVTANAMCVEGVLCTLPEPRTLKIRGEVVLPKARLSAINEERLTKGLSPYSNCRNAAAGALRNSDPLQVRNRKLSFRAYTLIDTRQYATEEEEILELRRLGVSIVPSSLLVGPAEVESYIDTATSKRDLMDIDVDGIVFKINNKTIQAEQGSTTSAPRWARAYKFPAKEAVTRLISVTWQVGRTGVLTPVAELRPVSLCGVEIRRATLHNLSEIRSKGIQINDLVVIQRAGDVIPEVTGSLVDMRQSNTWPIVAPDRCPDCGGKLHHTEKAITCVSDSCVTQKLRKLIFFFSKSGIDADGLGKAGVQAIFESGLAVCATDFFTLTAEQLVGLHLIGPKKAELIVSSIYSAANKCNDIKLLTAMGISLVGKDTSKILLSRFERIEDVLSATEDELMAVDGIGAMTAASIVREASWARPMLDQLRLYIKPNNPIATDTTDQSLAGKTFVITGTFDRPRPELKKYIEQRGGRVVSQVSPSTQFALVGESPGKSKMAKIAEYNIGIIGLDDI